MDQQPAESSKKPQKSSKNKKAFELTAEYLRRKDKTTHAVLTWKRTVRLINTVYLNLMDTIERRGLQGTALSLSVHVYAMFREKYSKQSHAEAKFIELVSSADLHSKNERIMLFCRFVGVKGILDEKCLALFYDIAKHCRDKL